MLRLSNRSKLKNAQFIPMLYYKVNWTNNGVILNYILFVLFVSGHPGMHGLYDDCRREGHDGGTGDCDRLATEHDHHHD